MEVVEDLSTDAFIKCLSRFISRRGKPKQLFSDNGTNFVGAKEELKRVHSVFSSSNQELEEQVTNKGIKWSMIPPRSPHFGGLWEASVKRAKFHLKTVIQNKKLRL